MTDYQVCGKVSINGKTRVLYSKTGSSKRYLKHKGRMMNLVNYKKMLAKKAEVKTPKKAPKRHGGQLEKMLQNLLNVSHNS